MRTSLPNLALAAGAAMLTCLTSLASALPQQGLSRAGQARDASAEEPLRSIRSPAVSYNNSLIRQRADPQILKHTDGRYYFIATVPAYDKVVMRQSDTIQGLTNARETTVWARSRSNAGVGYVWAPELHRIGGKWYIYFALGRASAFDIRPFVLEGEGENPVTARWTEKGFIKTNWETFSLDATTFEVSGTRYLCWAQNEEAFGPGTVLMLAPMVNPWTLKLPAVAITRPTLAWERIGHNVNEGPWVIQRNGRVFLTYSASATDHNYATGMLTADIGADLMNQASWRKSQVPVFQSSAATGQWGPGHSAFTVSEDGLSDLLVYHARNYRDFPGDPLNNPDRHTRVQKLYWKADGTPDFGIPVPDGQTPVRLRALVDERRYVSLTGGGPSVGLPATPPALPDTQFRIVRPGLATGTGATAMSLESTSHPGSFLRRQGAELVLAPRDNSAAFARDATFNQITRERGPGGEAGPLYAFQSVGNDGLFILGGGDNLVLAGNGDGSKDRQALFYVE